MTFNDKHQQKNENQEFSRISNKWTIHPKYNQDTGNNYDLCLIKLESPLNLIKGKVFSIFFNYHGSGERLNLFFQTIKCGISLN